MFFDCFNKHNSDYVNMQALDVSKNTQLQCVSDQVAPLSAEAVNGNLKL